MTTHAWRTPDRWGPRRAGSPVRRLAPDPIASESDPDWDYLCARAPAHGSSRSCFAISRGSGSRSRIRPARASRDLGYCRGRAKKCQFTLYRFLEVGARRGLATVLLKALRWWGPRTQIRSSARCRTSTCWCAPRTWRWPEWSARRSASASRPTSCPHSSIGWSTSRSRSGPISRRWSRSICTGGSTVRRFSSPIGSSRSGRGARASRCTAFRPRRSTPRPLAAPVTHFWSHWGHTLAPEQAPEPAALVEDTGGEAALKWVADLVFTTSRIAREIPAKTLSERAAEWSAQAETATTLALLTPLLAPRSLAFAQEVLSGLEAPAAPGWRRTTVSLPSPRSRIRR